MPSTFNTPSWKPSVTPGYVYVGEDEYYLYEDKQVVQDTAVAGSITLPLMRFDSQRSMEGPIVITDLDGTGLHLVAAQDSPFAKTYEAPIGADQITRTPEKYRRRVDLTGKQDGFSLSLVDHEFSIAYGLPDSSGWYAPIISISPSTADVIIEYENPAATGGYYRVADIDLNPLHSPHITDKFITVTDKAAVGERLSIRIASPTLSDSNINANTPILAYLETAEGMPVQGVDVVFTASDTGPGKGTLNGGSSDTVTTEWDGTAYTFWVNPGAGGTNHPAAGIEIVATYNDLAASGYIHQGIDR